LNPARMSRMRVWRQRHALLPYRAVLEGFEPNPQCQACFKRYDPVAGHWCDVAGDRVPARRSSWRQCELAQAVLQHECHLLGLPDWCFAET
jgi:hypothetical protein